MSDNRPRLYSVYHPDDEEPRVFERAPEDIERAIQRRLDNRPVVKCPDSDDCFIYDPNNFWDGPTHVYYDGAGNFTFQGWTGPQHFVLIGPLH